MGDDDDVFFLTWLPGDLTRDMLLGAELMVLIEGRRWPVLAIGSDAELGTVRWMRSDCELLQRAG